MTRHSVAAFAVVWVAMTVSLADVLYPKLEFMRMPFNNPGIGEIGSGYLTTATPFDADGDGDWDLSVAAPVTGAGICST